MSTKCKWLLLVVLAVGCNPNSTLKVNPLPPATQIKSISYKMQPGYVKKDVPPERFAGFVATFDNSNEILNRPTWEIGGEVWITMTDDRLVSVTVYITGYRQTAAYSVNGRYYEAESKTKLDALSDF